MPVLSRPFANRSRSVRNFFWCLALGLATLFNPLSAGDFPPYWDAGAGTAVHHQPVAWPDEGDWIAYTFLGDDIGDQASRDPSNGGTRPQNYVNVSSGCNDGDTASVFWTYDPGTQVLFFRWRVPQIANTFATGPSPGTFSATDPWNSALWTVLVEIDGDGFREFAFHLNGSSGAPATQVDTLASIWSDTPSQSIDYPNEADIFLVDHNPSSFVDRGSDVILNFQNSVTPVTSWPNGSSETVWDYGTTRSTLITPVGGCTEFLIDYQIPLAMLDATAVGGPAITENTPIALLFATANSLQNPLQKDVVLEGDYISDAGIKAPFGDIITPLGGAVPQPIIDEVGAQGCNPTSLTAFVRDTCNIDGSNSVTSVDFYYYKDDNNNGVDDDGNSWTFAAAGSNSDGNNWSGSWNSTGLQQGNYLFGARALDAQGNLTFSYLNQGEVAGEAGNPNDGSWYANPSPIPGVVTTSLSNSCGLAPPSISKSASVSEVSAGGTVSFTLTVTNTNSGPITLTQLNDSLPAGFTFVADNGGSLTPSTSPSNGDSGVITWGFGAGVSIAGSSSETLTFDVAAGTTVGTFTNTGSALITEIGTLVSDPIPIGVGAPELTFTKTADLSLANPGDTITYALTYSNNSPVGVTGISISDTLPEGVTFVSADNGGVFDAVDTITWNLGDLNSGEGPLSVSYQVSVDSPYPLSAAQNLVNTATISSNETADKNAQTSVFINTPRPSLVLQKEADAPLVAQGGTVAFTLSYANKGNATATSVVLTDAIPSGFTFLSAAPAADSDPGVGNTGTVTWNLGSLAANGSGSVTLTLQADNPFGGSNPTTNTAQIDSAETDPTVAGFDIGVILSGTSCTNLYLKTTTGNVGNDGTQNLATTTAPVSGTATTTANLVVGSAEQELERFYQDPASDGEIFDGDITVTLYGNKTGSPQLTFKGTLFDYDPTTGATVQLGTGSQNITGNKTNELIQFTITPSSDIPAGHRILVVVSALTNHASQTNNVSLNYDGTSSQSGISYCSAAPADLFVNKVVDSLTTSAGDSLSYTITFGNIGGSNTSGTTVVDTLPNGTTFVDATLNGFAAVPDSVVGSDYTFTVNSDDTGTAGQVTSGESGTLVINVSVDQPLSSAITLLDNSAEIDSSETNPESENATTIVLRPDLQITKTVSPSFVSVNDIVTYTVKVQNIGDATANNVVINDVLPETAYFTYLADSTDLDGINADPDPVAGGTLNLNIGSLTVGQSKTVTYQMQVAGSGLPDGLTVLGNTAAASSDQTPSTTSENVDLTINANPNLVLSKTSDAVGSLSGGDLITYTLTLSNNGGSAASDLFLSDPIPADTDYVPGSLVYDGSGNTDALDGDEGSFDGTNNRVIFTPGTLASGDSVAISFQVKVFPILANGSTTITNNASVTAANASQRSATHEDTVEAAPLLSIFKLGPTQLSYPLTTLDNNASATTEFDLADISQINLNQFLSIGGSTFQVTDIDGNTVTVDAPLTASAGTEVYGSLTHTIAYRNDGDAHATGTVLTDSLPAGAVFVEATGGGVEAAGTVTWNLGTLNSGSAGTVKVTFFPNGSGSQFNNAEITSNETGPETDDHLTEVGGLRVEKTTSTPSVAQTGSATATYQIRVTNTLAVDATGVVVGDILSSGFTYASTANISGFSAQTGTTTPTAGDEQPTWGTYTIAPGGTLVIDFTADIDGDVAAGTYQNEVTVSSDNASVTPFEALLTTAEDVTVTLVPALTVTKADQNLTVSPGETVTYTVTIANSGNAPVNNIVFTDTPDSNSQLAAGSITTDTGSVAGGNDGNAPVVVNIGTLNSGETAIVSFDVVVDSPLTGVAQLSNQGVVSSDELADINTDDPDTGAADDPTITPIQVNPAMTVTKTDGVSGALPGDTITYTINVANTGDTDLTGLVFTDTPDTNSSIVAASVTSSHGSVTGGNDGNAPVTVAIGTLAASDTAVISFQVEIDSPTAATEISNQATVTSNELAPQISDDPATGAADDPTITPLSALGLTVTKADENTTVNPGDTFTYTVIVENTGAGDVNNIVFTDTPDANTDIVPGSVTTDTGSIISGNDGTAPISVAIGTLASSAVATISFEVTVDSNLVGVGQLSNQGTVSSDELADINTDDPDTGAPDDATLTPVEIPELTILKSDVLTIDADMDAQVSPGDTLTYTLTVQNTGTAELTNITLSDTPDAHTAIVPASVTTDTGSVTAGNDGNAPITISIGTLAVGNTATISFDVTIDNPLTGVNTVSNQAIVSSDQLPDQPSDDPELPGEDDPTITPVASPAQLIVEKTDSLFDDADSSGTPSPGDTLLYIITINNIGGEDANNIQLSDVPDNNSSYVAGSATVSQGSITSETPTLTADIGTLAGGASATLTFRVLIDNPLADGVTRIRNQAAVTSDDTPSILSDDPDTDAGDDPTDTPVTADPFLSATKRVVLAVDADMNGEPSPGDTLTYTVKITNNGNQNAANVVFNDNPDGNTALIVGSVTTTTGTIDLGNTAGDAAVQVSVGTLAGSATSATISFQVLIDDPLPAGVVQVANQGTVSGDNFPQLPTDDPTTAADDDPTITPVTAGPNLVATKTDVLFTDADSDGNPSPGDTLLYTVTISNTGNSAATGVLFNDTPDENTSLVGGSVQSSRGSVLAETPEIQVDLGTLEGACDTVTISFRVTINSPLSAGVTTVANQGLVSSNELSDLSTDDPDTATNDDPTVTPVTAAPMISAVKRDLLQVDADMNGVPSPGDTLLYLIEVRNTGNQAGPATVVADTIDPNTTLVPGSIQSSQGTVTSTSPTIEVALGTLAGKTGQATVSFEVIIDNPLAAGVTALSNQAVISGDNFPDVPSDDPDTPDPDDPTDTPITADPQVSVAKHDLLLIDADTDGQVSPGDTLRYTLTIRNDGNGAAENVILTDVISDPSLTLITGSVMTTPTGLTVNSGNVGGDSTVAVQLGTIPGNGGSVTVTYRAQIASPLAAGVTEVANQAFASGDNFPDEPSDDPDTATDDDPTITPVNAAPIISASKRAVLAVDNDGNGVTSPGDTIAYSIQISNSGNIAASNLTYNDTPDSNTTLIAGSTQSSQGSFTSGSDGFPPVTLDIGNLNAGSSMTLSYRVTINSPLPAGVLIVSNQGLVSADGIPDVPTDDPDTPDPDDPTDVPVTADPLLNLTKRDTLVVDLDLNGVPSPGDTIRYDLTLRNDGNGAATNVLIEDEPDSNTTLVTGSVQTNRGTVLAGNAGVSPVQVEIGTIPGGASATVSFRVTINNPLPGGTLSVANQAVASADGLPDTPSDDPDTGTEDDPTITPVTADPILELEKTAALLVDQNNDGFAGPGDTLGYTLSLTNSGNASASGVQITDTPDSNTTIIAGTILTSRGSVTSGNDGNAPITIEIGSLPAGASAVATFRVLIADPFPAGPTSVGNQAVVSSNELPDEPSDDPETPDPDDPTITPVNLLPSLNAEKTAVLSNDVDSSGDVGPGDELTYTILVENSGSGTASGLSFSDTPDSNTTLVVGSVTTNSGSISSGNDGNAPVIVDLADMAPGGTATISFKVTVNSPLAGSVVQVSNQGTVSSNELPDVPTDNPDTPTLDDPTITPIVHQPELSVVKSDLLSNDVNMDGQVNPGDTLTYTITINNTGAGAATGVVISDTPDVNTELVVASVTTSAGSITSGNDGNPPVTVDIGTLPGSATATISFQVTVSDPLPKGVDQISNQGMLSFDQGPDIPTDDPDTVDPDDPTITPVEPPPANPAMSAEKTWTLEDDQDNSGGPSPGDIIRYTITLSNSGDQTLTGLGFADTPDDHTSVQPGSVTVSAGTVNSETPTIDIDLDNLAPAGSTTISFLVLVDPGLAPSVTQVVNQGVFNSNQLPAELTDDPNLPGSNDPTVTPLSTPAVGRAFKRDALFQDNDLNGVPSPGDIIAYTVTLSNLGSEDADNCSFTDIPDSNSSLVVGSVTTSQGTILSGNNGSAPVNIALGTMAGGSNATITFQVRINDPLASGVTRIVNQGIFSCDDLPDTVTDDPDIAGDEDPTITPVTTQPVLIASKTDTLFSDNDGDGLPSPGDALIYIVDIRNDGNGTADNVVFSDTPDGFTDLIPGSIISSRGTILSGNDGSVPLSVELGSLAGGESATISFQVLIRNPLPFGVTRVRNQGRVNSDQLPVVLTDDPDVAGLQDPTDTPLIANPLITVSKSDELFIDQDGNGAPSPGDTLLYRVSVLNSGNGAASGVVFRDFPDTNTAIVAGSVKTNLGTVTRGNDGNTPVEVEIGILPGGGGRADITFMVTINDPVPAGTDRVVNQGFVISNEYPTVLSDDPDVIGKQDPTVTPLLLVPELVARKVDIFFADNDDNGVPSAGDTLQYQVTITNIGSGAAENAVFTDTPDSNTTLVAGSVQTTQGTVTSGNDGNAPVGIALGTIAGNDTIVRISFQVTINDPIPAGVTFVRNQGRINADNHDDVLTDDPDVSGGEDPTDTEVTGSPDINSFKHDVLFEDLNAEGLPSPGDRILYQIRVLNVGSAPALDVVFSDTPDINTSIVPGSIQTSQGTVDSGQDGTAPISISLGVINQSDEAIISFLVDVHEPLPVSISEIVNQGVVTGSNFGQDLTSDPDNGIADSPTPTLVFQADLVIEITPSSNTIEPGVPFSFIIDVRNDGPSAAADVVVTDPLSEGLSFLNLQTPVGSWDYNAMSHTVTIELGDMASGDSHTLVMDVVLEDPNLTQVTNTAVISALHVDPQLSNNSSSAAVGVAVAIPTLGEWGLLALLAGLLSAALWMSRNRRG